MVERPSRRSMSGREALPEVREWSGGLPGGPGVVGWLFRGSDSGGEALPEVREWSGGFPRGPGVVGSGRETHPEVRESSRSPPGGPGVVGRYSRMSESGQEALPVVQEWA